MGGQKGDESRKKSFLNILFIDGRKVALLNFVTQLARTRLECLNKNVRKQPSMNTLRASKRFYAQSCPSQLV